MSAKNSGIATKACTYDFSKDGGLGSGVFAHSGITIKPGETILDIKAKLAVPIATASPTTTYFQFGWAAVPASIFTFGAFFSDTVQTLNTNYWWYWGQSNVLNQKFSDTQSPGLPFYVPFANGMWFTSTAALTAGRVHFIITYQYAKF